jgi:hypothetical protein
MEATGKLVMAYRREFSRLSATGSYVPSVPGIDQFVLYPSQLEVVSIDDLVKYLKVFESAHTLLTIHKEGEKDRRIASKTSISFLKELKPEEEKPKENKFDFKTTFKAKFDFGKAFSAGSIDIF